MRTRINLNEKNIKLVFTLRKAGCTTPEIIEMTGLGRSTIQSLIRKAKALSDKDYNKLFDAHDTSRLTDKAIKQVNFICDAAGISKPSEKELREAWAIYKNNNDNETIDEMAQFEFEVQKDEGKKLVKNYLAAELLTLRTVLDIINSKPFAEAIDEINERIETNETLALQIS